MKQLAKSSLLYWPLEKEKRKEKYIIKHKQRKVLERGYHDETVGRESDSSVAVVVVVVGLA